MMPPFSDDEPPPAISSAAGPKHVRGGHRVRLVAHCNEAPLVANEQRVLLEVTVGDAPSTAAERAGLDLVAVLDVAGRGVGGDRQEKLRRAMKFVIGKLGPADRLSIVVSRSAGGDAERRLCPLRVMSEAAKKELVKDVVEEGLMTKAGGYASWRHGLETGRRVLAERRHSGGRVASIVLISGGEEHPTPLPPADSAGHADAVEVPVLVSNGQDPSGGAMDVDVGDVAVYTFGFGEGHNAKVLEAIASKSNGGTFHYVSDENSLTVPLAEILGGLLSVVVQDVKLTIRQQPGHSTIQATDVYAGSYLPATDSAGWVTVSFGDLFSGEVRKVSTRVLLPAVHSECRVAVLAARCSYRIQGKTFYSPPHDDLRCSMHRTTPASLVAMNTKVGQERERISYVRMIGEVTKDLGVAQSKLREHQIDEAVAAEALDHALGRLEEHRKVLEAKPPNPMTSNLIKELQQLLNLRTWALLAALLALRASHVRQRGGWHFATPRMCRYAAQAAEFDKDPSKPPQPDTSEEEQKKPWVVWRPGSPERAMSSGSLAWAAVILCAVLAAAVAVAGAAVFAVYMILKPKMPYLVVSDAQLGLLQYDQLGGTIQSLQMSITILAENNNSKADATFSRVDLALGFDGVDVALLRAEPFMVPRQSYLPLRYDVVSSGRTLDTDRMKAMDAALQVGVLPLDLLGKARTRWKVGVFVRLRYWTRISCRLRFFPGNGTVMPTDRDRCRSR